MSRQLKGLLFLNFLLISQTCFACFCTTRPFCEFLKYEDNDYKMVTVRAKVLDKIDYQDNTNAAYFEVLETYRDDINVGNFIKLHGYTSDTWCHASMHTFTPSTEVILIIGGNSFFYDEMGELSFPFQDLIFDETDYWESIASVCSFLALTIEDGLVKGKIADGFSEYPWEHFNDRLENCDFNQEELDAFEYINNDNSSGDNPQELGEFNCSDNNYILYPNPSLDGKITIRNSSDSKPPISQIRVFDTSGRLVIEKSYTVENSTLKTLNIAHKGVFFVEIFCGEQKQVRRIVVV